MYLLIVPRGRIRAARQYLIIGTKAGELDTKLGYFEHNAHRMRYRHFRELGMFTGSGAIEAGCKAIVVQRAKQSGMHWTTAGAAGHHCPALPARQRPLGRALGRPSCQPGRAPGGHLTDPATQTHWPTGGHTGGG